MRRLLVVALLVSMALPSLALKRAPVSQLEEMLIELHSAHKQDGEISRQIGGMELSERLSDGTLDRLNKQFAVGSQTAVALQLLADQSAFLNLLATEVPSMPAPDSTTRDKQLEKARKFAAETRSSLTDLTATRINERTIVCPVRSLALSSATLDIKAAFNGATTRWLNENVFADYHGPVSTSRSVGDNSPASSSGTNPTGKTHRR